MKRLPCLIVMLWALLPLAAQQPHFRHYGVEQGLSNNKVICTLQDSLGFLWVGTPDGLNRFDGYNFKVFRHDPGDATSIGSNHIHSLTTGPNKELLVGTDKGIYQFDFTTEKFACLVAQPSAPLSHITPDPQGNIWFVSARELKRFTPATRQLHTFGQSQVPFATAVCTTADGAVWGASANGNIYRFDPSSASFSAFDLFSHSPNVSSTRIITLFGTADTNLLVGTSNQGVKLFSVKTKTYKDLLPYASDKTELYVRGFSQSNPQEYWVATEKGIFILNTRTGVYQHLQKGFANPYSLSDNAVYTLCKDREGGIWAGTNFGGLNYFPKQYTPFQKFFPGSNVHALSGNVVHDITADRLGHIWIGTEDAGLNRWNPASGKVTYYMPAAGKEGIAYTNVHGLLAVGNELWVGTFEHGLDVLDIRTGRVLRHYRAGNGPNQLRSNFIVTLYQTRAGDILVGTWNGLFRYRRPSNDFELFQQFTGQVQSIREAADGTLWLCTLDNGVYYFLKNGTQGHLRFEDDNPNSLASNTVHSQYHDSSGNIWFATEGGLCRYQPKAGKFKNYTVKEGLPQNVVYRIEQDQTGSLWVSTTNGLANLNPATGQVRTYTTANGLVSDHFNFNSSFKDASGRLYFGSMKGMIAFNPAEFLPEQFRPPLYFTQIIVNDGREEHTEPGVAATHLLNNGQEMKLRHHQSTLSIDFAAVSFTAPQTTQYRYKLEGLEEDWTALKTARRLYFSSLRPGSYRLRLQVINPSGSSVLAERVLRITILPPWWASKWASALYGLLALGLGCWLFSLYHHRTRRQAGRKIELMGLKKEKELYEAKMDFFTNVAHEIRTPLTLIKGPLERVLRKVGDQPDLRNSLHIMERNTERLIALTSQLLDFRKAETNGFRMHLKETDVSELLQVHFLEVKPLAESQMLAYRLSLPQHPVVAPADTEVLDKIFGNLLSNAVKYAEKKVAVRLEPAEPGSDFFAVYFENDGPVIPASMQENIFEPFFRVPENARIMGSGIGLALARSLAVLHGGSLTLVPHQTKNIFRLLLQAGKQRQEVKPYKENTEPNGMLAGASF